MLTAVRFDAPGLADAGGADVAGAGAMSRTSGPGTCAGFVRERCRQYQTKIANTIVHTSTTPTMADPDMPLLTPAESDRLPSAFVPESVIVVVVVVVSTSCVAMSDIVVLLVVRGASKLAIGPVVLPNM